MDPEGSFVSSQQPATAPYPKPDESSPRLPILFLEDPFNTNHPPTLPSAQSLSCSFSNQNPITYQHNV